MKVILKFSCWMSLSQPKLEHPQVVLLINENSLEAYSQELLGFKNCLHYEA